MKIPCNFQFLEAVRKYKRLKEEDLKTGAQRIVRIFIGVGSQHPVNISGEVISQIEEAMSVEGTSPREWRKLFDEAYAQVFHLLKNDSFARFIQSINFSAA